LVVPWRRSILAGLIYFALVFALGFVLGTLRVLYMAPLLGERWAVLIELPVIVAGCAAAAVVGLRAAGLHAERQLRARAVMGLVAVGLLLTLELSLVRWLRGLSLRDALIGGDWVATLAYRASLFLMGVIPVLLAPGRPRATGGHRIG